MPLIARWPGHIPAGSTSDQLISQVDILATLAAIIGRELKEDEGVDSIDQLETLTGSPDEPARETLVISPNSPKHLLLRHKQWVFIPAQGAGGFQGKLAGEHLFSGAAALPFAGRVNSDVAGGKIKSGAPAAQLYDLRLDPKQTTNLFTQHPEVARELSLILDDYREQIPAVERVGWVNLMQ